MDAWTTALGTSQGRIQPTGWTAPNGAYAVVLGHDLPNQWVKLAVGDFDSVTQTIDLAGVSFVRIRVHLRPPASMPAGLTWRLAFFINADTSLFFDLDRDRDLYDLALPAGAYQSAGAVPIQVLLLLHGVGSAPVDVELPAVYLDTVTSDTTPAAIAICNRNPEPNEQAVPLTLPAAFLVVDPTGTSYVDDASIVVTIGGVIALSGGAAQNGFTGGIANTDDGFGFFVTLTPPAPWLSLVTYSVQVQATTNSGAPLDVTYSFTAEDTVAPVVVSAFATDDKIVRVTFDEPVVGDGLYVITLVSGVPAVTPVVVSTTDETSTTVLLTLDTEQTPGATYEVTVTGVADLFGNSIAAPMNTAQWSGYACAGVAGRSFDLYGMMLRSDRAADETGDLRNFIGCFQEVTNLLLCKIDRFVEIFDPDTAVERYVDQMLTDMGNPFAFDLTVIDKRRLVQLLVAIYRSKGTDAGIINAIRFFLGLEVTITVPWQTSGLLGASTLGGTFILGTGDLGTIYSFIINSPVVLTDEQRKRITLIARYMKRAPTHFKVVEPAPPPSIPSHWSLGVSSLGLNTLLH